MKKCFEINTIPTALMVKYFCPLMINTENQYLLQFQLRLEVFQIILGGWYSYRASKAALNQIIKTSSIEQKD